MSGFGVEVVTGGDNRQPPPQTLDLDNLGDGFSVIDINTVSGFSSSSTGSGTVTITSVTSIRLPRTTTFTPTTTMDLEDITTEISRSRRPPDSGNPGRESDPPFSSIPDISPFRPPPPPTHALPTLIFATTNTAIASATAGLGNSLESPGTATPQSNNTLSPGVIAGIVIGSLAALLLIGFGIFKLIQYRRKVTNGTTRGGISKPSRKDRKQLQMEYAPYKGYLGSERSLEEAWESESTLGAYSNVPLDFEGENGLGVRGLGLPEINRNGQGTTRLPIGRQ